MRKILGAWVFVVAVGLAIGALGALGNQIYMGGSGGAAWRTASGDWTINSAGVNLIGNSAITTVKINNAAVTYAKIQNVGASSLLGNPTGSPAIASEITLGSGLSFSGSTLIATGSGGTVTSVTCNNGLSGGTITTTGTCSLDTTHANTWSGVQTFDNGDLSLAGSSSGNSLLEAPASGGGTVTFQAGSYTDAALNLADQVITGGANVTSQSQSAGNISVDCGARPAQYIPNTGAFTITAPSNDGYCYLDVENGAGAGAVSLSGFSPNTMGGATLDTTNGHNFRLVISRVHGHSNIFAVALQ